MRPTFVKVCCVQSVDEAKIAVSCGAHLLGLVGEMPSGPGCLTDNDIAHITSNVESHFQTVLLSSRCEANALLDHVRVCKP
jgi:phosphoribosylanthranilate isomerase